MRLRMGKGKESILYVCLLLGYEHLLRGSICFVESFHPMVINKSPSPLLIQENQQRKCSALYLAKRKKNTQSKQDMEQFNSWYDKVDDDATPDDIFWEEMERQRNLSDADREVPLDAVGAIGNSGTTAVSSPPSLGSNQPASFPTPPTTRMPDLTIAEEKNADAILASFAGFMVSDNWLDERYLLEKDSDDDPWDDLEEQDRILDEQISELQNGEEETNGIFKSYRAVSNEPWDTWGTQNSDEEDELDIDMEKGITSHVFSHENVFLVSLPSYTFIFFFIQ